MASRIRGMGEREVVFTRGEYANEAVNNDGFFLFLSLLLPPPPLSFTAVSLLPRLARTRIAREIVFHRVGGIIEKRAKREKDFYPRQL